MMGLRIHGKDVPWSEVPRKVAGRAKRALVEAHQRQVGFANVRRISRVNYEPGRPIRVAFIVQMPEVWDKEAPVYEAMLDDDSFEPWLVIVPHFDFEKKRLGDYGSERGYFEGYARGGNVVYAFDGEGYSGLEEFGFDYVFYQRPYDGYLPRELKSASVARYAKVCYVPYAYWVLGHDLCGYNDEFFTNIYLGFFECDEHAGYVRSRLSPYNRILSVGYPAMEARFAVSDSKSVSTEKGRRSKVRLLWTPRWSYDPVTGGSHFFEYRDRILELKRRYPEFDVTIRPHPLAFENYVSLGMMTSKDVESYKSEAAGAGVQFDGNELVEETFESTDILLTDVSSIDFVYALSAKPIVFCQTEVPLSPAFLRATDCMYITDSWSDIEQAVLSIARGNDQLAQKRLSYAQLLLETNDGASARILRAIQTDHDERSNPR